MKKLPPVYVIQIKRRGVSPLYWQDDCYPTARDGRFASRQVAIDEAAQRAIEHPHEYRVINSAIGVVWNSATDILQDPKADYGNENEL